ncbi:MAG: hypothetical protein M3R61_00320 [Chloroflexota bacterium]|nr:hypothetical protein [Chloroflexota bacterium]
MVLHHIIAPMIKDASAKLNEIQRRLGHKNIATTSLYLQALTNEENPYAEAIEGAIGVEG